MAVYNVAVTTVVLVEAPSEAEAKTAMTKYVADALRDSAVEVMPEETHAFESEPLEEKPSLFVLPTGVAVRNR